MTEYRRVSDRLDPTVERVGGVVPRGFEAYARILHPAWRLTGRPGNVIRTPVRWSEIASTRGTQAHRLMQWRQVWALPVFDDPVIDVCLKAGMAPIECPDEGRLPSAVADPLKNLLASDDMGWFGVWYGYGTAYKSGLQKMGAIRTRDREWDLFRAPLSQLDFNFLDVADEMGATANLIWPDDARWCIATEIDHMCTYVGGSQELISKVLHHEGLESYEAYPDDHAWLDTVNPPSENTEDVIGIT